MFIENYVISGDSVIPVPLGLDIAVQYNDKGVIQKIYRGFDKSVNISNEVLHLLVSNQIVPSSIRIKGGTTWVYGILTTDVDLMITGNGALPECNYDIYIDSFIRFPDKFKFRACNVESLGVVFQGGDMKSRNWLNIEGFDVLPSYLMPANISNDTFEYMIARNPDVFTWPLIMGFYIFRNGMMTYQSTNLQQQLVKNIAISSDETGTIITDIEFEDAPSIREYEYPNINRLGIKRNSLIIYKDDDDSKTLIYNYDSDYVPDQVMSCPTCGALINIPKFGRMHCSDEHCPSMMYSRVRHMLGVFDLPIITQEKYNEIVGSTAFDLIDVFSWAEYENIDISVSIPKALKAVIPPTILPGQNTHKVFVAKCNFSIDTVEYYVDNSHKFWEDLDLDRNVYTKFYDWLQFDKNRGDIHDILHDSHISILLPEISEDSAPTLRDSLVYITGKFAHGTYEIVSQILSTYGATTTTEYSDEVTHVVVGDIPDNIYGSAIQKAKVAHKPIIPENVFFHRYRIVANTFSDE